MGDLSVKMVWDNSFQLVTPKNVGFGKQYRFGLEEILCNPQMFSDRWTTLDVWLLLKHNFYLHELTDVTLPTSSLLGAMGAAFDKNEEHFAHSILNGSICHRDVFVEPFKQWLVRHGLTRWAIYFDKLNELAKSKRLDPQANRDFQPISKQVTTNGVFYKKAIVFLYRSAAYIDPEFRNVRSIIQEL